MQTTNNAIDFQLISNDVRAESIRFQSVRNFDHCSKFKHQESKRIFCFDFNFKTVMDSVFSARAKSVIVSVYGFFVHVFG
jgi:hypothetical protein